MLGSVEQTATVPVQTVKMVIHSQNFGGFSGATHVAADQGEYCRRKNSIDVAMHTDHESKSSHTCWGSVKIKYGWLHDQEPNAVSESEVEYDSCI